MICIIFAASFINKNYMKKKSQIRKYTVEKVEELTKT